MRANRGLSLGIVLCAVVGAACGQGSSATNAPTSAPTTAAATTAPGTAAPATSAPTMVLPSFPAGAVAFAQFEPKAGAGTQVQGGATLLEVNGQTQVIIGVTSSTGETMAAGIQAGTCDNLTPEMTHRLTDVVNGTSLTSLDVDVDTLLATPFAINIFVAGSETESSITCGEIQPIIR